MSDDEYIKRTPEHQATVDTVAMEVFGRKQTEGQCVMCGGDKMNREDFRDDLSFRESRISYTCQPCQDELEEEMRRAAEDD